MPMCPPNSTDDSISFKNMSVIYEFTLFNPKIIPAEKLTSETIVIVQIKFSNPMTFAINLYFVTL